MQDSSSISHNTQDAHNTIDDIISTLDLEEFIGRFYGFLVRKQHIYLNGDFNIYKQIIDELETLHLPPMPPIIELKEEINLLKKMGVLGLGHIGYFARLINFFNTLKKNTQILPEMLLFKRLENISIPSILLEIASHFSNDGELKSGVYPMIDKLNNALNAVEKNIKEAFNDLFSNQTLQNMLVDKQIHLINNTQTLLLKAGYNAMLKGAVIARSQGGFFYVLPYSVEKFYSNRRNIQERLDDEIFKLCKEISSIFNKHVLFFSFINKEFSLLDSLMARVAFAKAFNLSFILPSPKSEKNDSTNEIILNEFSHPILENPVPISIDFSKNLLIITGVNAGGKTILLKSILASVFLAQYLLPMRINPHKSKIPHFKHIKAIIADPQYSKNDISTFAGRMLEFSKILGMEGLIVGIDEIELGTDADEAASLYKILLETLLEHNAKIIVTTHHKRLASLMACNDRVQMSAAMYDIHTSKPTFNFMHGTIGKSYAFETAQRYGIPKNIIDLALTHYGSDKQRLNELIEQSVQLEIDLRLKHDELTKEINNLKQNQQTYLALSEKLQEQYDKKHLALEQTYKQALDELKKEAKTMSDAHRNITKANKILANKSSENNAIPTKQLAIGDRVKYNSQKGYILHINDKQCLVELDSGMRLKINQSKLKKISQLENTLESIQHTYKNNKKSSSISLALTSNVSIDLHGLRAEEALERVDKFLSDSLIAGFDEVLICHGIGTGRLAKVIADFLKDHPRVVSFSDAPSNMGGIGAKIVRL